MKLQFLIAVVATVLSVSAPTESEQLLPPHVWGKATNGLSCGIRVIQSHRIGHAHDFYCDIDVRNLSTNRLYIRILPLEQRYEIKLLGPDGRQIRQLKPLFWSYKQLWLYREPFNLDPLPERKSIDWFWLKETFDVRTNGLHTLIVSVRANAFTNYVVGRNKMRQKPAYFLLPPVTNVFNILP